VGGWVWIFLSKASKNPRDECGSESAGKRVKGRERRRSGGDAVSGSGG